MKQLVQMPFPTVTSYTGVNENLVHYLHFQVNSADNAQCKFTNEQVEQQSVT